MRTPRPHQAADVEELREPRPQAPPPAPDRSRKAFEASPPATVLPLEKCLATFPCPFDGVVQDACTGCTHPPDPNAAAGAGRIVQVVNNLIQVTTRFGAVQCGGPVTLNRLLGGTLDNLTDPRVQFDNINQRFSLVVTISSVTANDTPALWVAATQGDDPCGTWMAYRMTFDGDATQPARSSIFRCSHRTRAPYCSRRGTACPPRDARGSSCLPSRRHRSTQAQTSTPLLQRGLAHRPGHARGPAHGRDWRSELLPRRGPRRRLQGLCHGANSIRPGAVLENLRQSLLDTESRGPAARYQRRGRLVRRQHHLVALLRRHEDLVHPRRGYGDISTVKYGAINIPDVTVSTAYASHSPWSDDFNPSLAVVLSRGGKPSTSPGPRPTRWWPRPPPPSWPSHVDAAQPLKNLFGVSTAYATGGNSTTVRFGDYSSVSVDPTTSDCAFATQQLFDADGSWRTRIVPLGDCGGVVIKPWPGRAGDRKPRYCFAQRRVIVSAGRQSVRSPD